MGGWELPQVPQSSRCFSMAISTILCFVNLERAMEGAHSMWAGWLIVLGSLISVLSEPEIGSHWW